MLQTQLGMLCIALGATLLVGGAVALGKLSIRRDGFFLLFYVQSLLYLDVAPAIAAADVSTATQEQYVWIQGWAFVLFQLPLLFAYLCALRQRRDAREHVDRSFRFSAARLQLLVGAITASGVGYFVVAVRNGLLYRRIGGEELAAAQLQMSTPEFAVYRVFLELGLFLCACLLVVLRLPAEMRPSSRATARAGFVVAAGLWLGYALVNSRLTAVLTIAALWTAMNAVDLRPRRFSPRLLLGIPAMLFFAGYAMQIVSNIREAHSTGGAMLALENFMPAPPTQAQPDDELQWRMNGIDLIATISQNVEAQGAAHGRAWAVPLLLSLDPIVRTPFTIAAKRAALTTAKSWLLLEYGGVSKTDYYSCMLSDVYGNFSVYGFPIAGILLGIALGISTRALRRSSSPVAIVFALFVITRILPFEQEFETVLFGWYRLVPFVLLVVAIYPVRRRFTRKSEPLLAASSAIS